MAQQAEHKRVPQRAKANIYLQYQRLAAQLARQFSAHYFLIPKQEIADEAIGILAEVATRWDDPKIAFNPELGGTTHRIYQKIYWGLKTFCMRTYKPMTSLTPRTSGEDGADDWDILAPAGNGLEIIQAAIGDDARRVLETIIDAPAHIADEIIVDDPTVKYRRLVGWNLIGAGWTPQRVNAAWRELEQAVPHLRKPR